MTVRYAITANPTKRSNTGDSKGKRVALHDYDTILAWWTRKTLAAGLDITDQPTRIDPAPHSNGTKTGPTGTHRITHRASRIEGTAIITDPNALRTTLITGIGAGKAHGLGLLTIAPHRG